MHYQRCKTEVLGDNDGRTIKLQTTDKKMHESNNETIWEDKTYLSGRNGNFGVSQNLAKRKAERFRSAMVLWWDEEHIKKKDRAI